MKLLPVLCVMLLIAGCTSYDGAAYIKADLNRMDCSKSPAHEVKMACINSIVDEEYFKGGVSYLVIDTMRDINRWKYSSCMQEKGFSCTWGPENK